MVLSLFKSRAERRDSMFEALDEFYDDADAARTSRSTGCPRTTSAADDEEL
jgi:hypothetical protein